MLAFAGIARPTEFFNALVGRGICLVGTMALEDHQEYDAALLNRLRDACPSLHWTGLTRKTLRERPDDRLPQ